MLTSAVKHKNSKNRTFHFSRHKMLLTCFKMKEKLVFGRQMQSPPISEGSSSSYPSHPSLFLYLSWHLPVQDEEHFFCTKVFQRSGRVLLNIGSGRFETSKETLLSVPSYFGSLLSGRFSFLAVGLLCHGVVIFLGSTQPITEKKCRLIRDHLPKKCTNTYLNF